jgi:hypothetical protein
MFFKPVVKTLKKVDKTNQILDAINLMQRQEVLIGIPQEDTARKIEPGTQPVTNAELAYIHTYGSPLQHIPARPFLQPPINANIDVLIASMQKTLQAALAGNSTGVEAGFKKTGMLGRDFAKKWFTDPRNNWAPNALYTAKIKIAKKFKSKKKFNAAVAAFQAGDQSYSMPLIDTGALRNAITYVIRDRQR